MKHFLLFSILIGFISPLAALRAEGDEGDGAGVGAVKPIYVCTARNLAGKRFSAEGDDKVLTQEEAMRKCEAVSSRCYKTGCKKAHDRG